MRSLEETVHELEINQIELQMQNEELRRTQATLETSRERYVDFYDFAPVGFITLTSDGRLDELNLTAATMLGEERNKLIHRNFSHIVAPEDRDRWKRQFLELLQYNKKVTCELRLLRKEGPPLHVQLDCLHLQKSEQLNVLRIAMTDITGHIAAEDIIREQEEIFRMITENIEDFVAVIDLEGRRVYNSPSYAKLFSNYEKMKGTDSFSEVHPDDRKYVMQIFHETVNSGSGMKIEYRFVLEDGSVRYIESRGTLIRDRYGQPSRVLVISRDITERKKIEETILNLAYFDALTQLPNRRMLNDRMNLLMASSKRSGHYCALMFIDLDNFKPLNDRFGHSAGDMLLQEVAHRISSCMREMDTVARFGGDEFVVLLSELNVDMPLSIEHAGNVAEKILAAIAKPYALTIKGKDNQEIHYEHHCTASIGVVMFIDHDHSADELIKQADIEMYRAKGRGRNQVCFHRNSA